MNETLIAGRLEDARRRDRKAQLSALKYLRQELTRISRLIELAKATSAASARSRSTTDARTVCLQIENALARLALSERQRAVIARRLTALNARLNAEHSRQL